VNGRSVREDDAMPMDHIIELILDYWRAGKEERALALFRKHQSEFSGDERFRVKRIIGAKLSGVYETVSRMTTQELERFIREGEALLVRQGKES